MNYMDVRGDKDLIIYLNKSSNQIKPQILSALKLIGQHVEEEAKKKFGTYQRSWPKLKRASVTAKYRRRALGNGVKRPNLSGIASFINTGVGDDPLILMGKLKESIKHELNESQLEAVIFSDDKKAAVHEYGYAPKKIPARSYLRLALWDSEKDIEEILARKIGGAL
jgi:phage gpG-like protein